MIVSITGGSGFIGRELVRHHVMAGDCVRVLTRRRPPSIHLESAIEIHYGDLASSLSPLEAFVDDADILYHCAGEIRDTGRMHAVHVTGASRLAKAARNRIGRWVQLSSVGVYGPRREGEVTEESSLNPIGAYEQTKAESDRVVVAAAQEGWFSFSMLRPSIVFGPTMTNRSLFQLIRMIDRRLFFFVGKPGASANYIYVGNVIQALVGCGKLPAAAGRIYNLSDRRTMETLAGAIAQALRRPEPSWRLPETPVRWAARLGRRFAWFPLTEARVDALVNRASYPSTRIEQELGYAPAWSMEQGIDEMVAAFRKQS